MSFQLWGPSREEGSAHLKTSAGKKHGIRQIILSRKAPSKYLYSKFCFISLYFPKCIDIRIATV